MTERLSERTDIGQLVSPDDLINGFRRLESLLTTATTVAGEGVGIGSEIQDIIVKPDGIVSYEDLTKDDEATNEFILKSLAFHVANRSAKEAWRQAYEQQYSVISLLGLTRGMKVKVSALRDEERPIKATMSDGSVVSMNKVKGKIAMSNPLSERGILKLETTTFRHPFSVVDFSVYLFDKALRPKVSMEFM